MTTFNLQWPQIIWIVLASMKLANHIFNHGKPFNPIPKYNTWVALLSIAIVFTLLWQGGFFNPVHAQVPMPTSSVCHER